MPLLTRWAIRLSFLYLPLALVVGLLVALRPLLSLPSLVGRLGPVYFHLFLVGWVTQLVVGVVYWLFPTPPEDGRSSWQLPLGWATLLLLNSGLLLRVIAEPLGTGRPDTVWGWLLVVSALLQWLGGLAFVAMVWPRTWDRKAKRRKGGR